MAKKVVVIVSGETDRRCVPHLCRELVQQTSLFDVRKPPANAALTVPQAEKLIKAAWYELKGRGNPPEKFVVLVDTDGQEPEEVIKPFEDATAKLADIPVPKLIATAVRHLEAWFFGHAEELRNYLARDLGGVDASKPDEIENPKLHLMNLLRSRSRVYTSPVAEQIAERLDQATIEGRSLSFANFLDKVRNGQPN